MPLKKLLKKSEKDWGGRALLPLIRFRAGMDMGKRRRDKRKKI